MSSFLWQSSPFIVGFILQGEPALIFWLSYFNHRTDTWLWIFLLAYAISYGSLLGYYALGRIGFRLGSMWEKTQSLLEKHQARFPNIIRFWHLLVLKFLYGLRNPLTIYIGLRRYPLPLFAFWAGLGNALWLIAYFAGVWFLQWQFQEVFHHFQRYLLFSYGVIFVIWLLFLLFRRKVSHLRRKERG